LPPRSQRSYRPKRRLTHGRRLTDEEILIYNSFMSKRGWHDDETDGFIPEMIKHYGLSDNGTVLTDFDLIEMDEGRWRPDMWRAPGNEIASLFATSPLLFLLIMSSYLCRAKLPVGGLIRPVL
jgi:hypothetical protein